MENVKSKAVYIKRSAGVTFFALSIIVISIFRLLGTGSLSIGFSQILSRAVLILIIVYSVISNIFLIIGSVSILRLKDWARKLVLLLTALQLLYMLIVSMPLSSRSIEFMRTLPNTQERIWAGYTVIPEKLRLENNITKEQYSTLVFRKIYQTASVVKIISILYLLLVLLYFTRSKVKKQFATKRALASETGK